MARVIIDKTKFTQKLEAAFQETCFLLGRSFTQVISDPGAFADFPAQDIVDTGVFRASQRLNFLTPGAARFSWNTEYSIYLLKGWTTRSGSKVEGRDWIAEGLRRSRSQEVFRELVRKQLKSD